MSRLEKSWLGVQEVRLVQAEGRTPVRRVGGHKGRRKHERNLQKGAAPRQASA